jgi:hypothetical protein
LTRCERRWTLRDTQLRPVLFRLQDRRLPLPGQILEASGLEQRLVELAPLAVAQLAEGISETRKTGGAGLSGR